MMGIYDQHMPAYADAGLPVFPVDPRAKRPAVRGWQKADPRLARGWAKRRNLAECDGLGIVMGKPSGITEVDVDAVGDAWLYGAVQRFGDTPIVIRTASGKAKLWYRHNGEGRHIRPLHGQPIDVLGGGYTIAPPTWRGDLGESYRFLRGGIGDIANLPTIRTDALEQGFSRAAEGIQRGERNDGLWRYCMAQARSCDDVEALIDVAVTWASAFHEPLSPTEAERCARSAWAYESSGRNYLGLRKPILNRREMVMYELRRYPDAYYLLMLFQQWHSHRPTFAIAPKAMSDAGNPPWPRRKIERARDVLLEQGYLVEVSPPRRGIRAGQYRLDGEMCKSAHNHYTPPPPALEPSLAEGWQ